MSTPRAELDAQHDMVALSKRPFPFGDSISTREPSGTEWFGVCVFSADDVSVVLVKSVYDPFGDSSIKPNDKIAFWI